MRTPAINILRLPTTRVRDHLRVQRAANIEQRYFCRRKIDVFVHICVYAENKRCILQLSYLYGISAYLDFHS